MAQKQSLSQKKRLFNVPYEIVRYIVHNGIFGEAAVYFTLKYRCDGLIEITPALLKDIGKELNVNARTIKRRITWLIKQSWITKVYDKTYRVKSFDKLYHQIRLGKSTQGILWDPPNFNETKTFCIAACVSHLIRCQQMARKRVPNRKRLSGTQTSTPIWQLLIIEFTEPSAFNSDKGYISKSYFALKMKIPESTAYDYLAWASVSGLKKTGNLIKVKTPSEEDFPRLLDDSMIRKFKLDHGELFLTLPNSFTSKCIHRQRSRLKLCAIKDRLKGTKTRS